MHRSLLLRMVWWLAVALVAISLFKYGCRPRVTPPVVNPTVVPMGTDIAALLQNLDAKSAPRRDNFARYLGELGARGELGEYDEKVLAKLRQLAQKDPNPNVKATAREAIEKIEGGE